MKLQRCKYKVPAPYRKVYDGKKIIYCVIMQKVEANNKKVYLVKMINHHNRTNVFNDSEVQKLNIIDKIKLKFL